MIDLYSNMSYDSVIQKFFRVYKACFQSNTYQKIFIVGVFSVNLASTSTLVEDTNSESESPAFKTAQLLTKEARYYEKKGQVSRAITCINQALEIYSQPSIKFLTYAMYLNQKDTKTPQSNIEMLNKKIFESLRVFDGRTIKLLSLTSFNDLEPLLDYLLDLKITESRKSDNDFDVRVPNCHRDEFFGWMEKVQTRYTYPIALTFKNVSNTIEGICIPLTFKLSIENFTRREKSVRDDFTYEFLEGKLDSCIFDEETFYNLMVRSPFLKSDFEKNCYGHSDMVWVKGFEFSKDSLKNDAVITKKIKESLKKVKQPFFACALDFKKSRALSVDSISIPEFTLNPKFTVLRDSANNVLYICGKNDYQYTLDLHGLKLREAREKSLAFLKEKVDQKSSVCKIITGRGNHLNANGSRGVIRDGMARWIEEPDFKKYVRCATLDHGGGAYEIQLNVH